MNRNKIQTEISLCGQIFSCLVVLAIVSLTVLHLIEIELPEMSDRELFFWLVEIN